MLPYRSVSSYRTTRIVRNPIGIGRDARFSSSPRVCMFVQPIALFISLLNFCSSPITNYKIGASATQTVQPHILYTFILYTNGINIQSKLTGERAKKWCEAGIHLYFFLSHCSRSNVHVACRAQYSIEFYEFWTIVFHSGLLVVPNVTTQWTDKTTELGRNANIFNTNITSIRLTTSRD